GHETLGQEDLRNRGILFEPRRERVRRGPHHVFQQRVININEALIDATETEIVIDKRTGELAAGSRQQPVSLRGKDGAVLNRGIGCASEERRVGWGVGQEERESRRKLVVGEGFALKQVEEVRRLQQSADK